MINVYCTQAYTKKSNGMQLHITHNYTCAINVLHPRTRNNVLDQLSYLRFLSVLQNMVFSVFTIRTCDEEKEWPQILAIGIGSLVSLSMGMLTTWTSPYIPVLLQDKESYSISPEEASYLPSIAPVVATLTIPLLFTLPDRIGRKYTLLLAAIPYFICWVLTALARGIYVFYLSRAFEGISDGLVFSALSMYAGEVATPKVRGVWGNGLTVFNYIGQFFINVIGPHLTIQQSSYIGMTIPVFFVVLFSLMPESPYYFLMKKRDEDARKSLQWLHCTMDVNKYLAQIKEDVERQMSERGTWAELFTIKANRKAWIAGTFLRIAQQFSGLSVLYAYTKYIFELSHSSISPNVSIVLFTGLNCILNVVSSFSSHYLGRRKSFILSLLFCSFSMAPLAVYFYILEFHPELDVSHYRWVPLASMLSYISSAAFGVAIIPSLMYSELFSASIKAKGICILLMQAGVISTAVNLLFYYMSTSFGTYSPFVLFSVSAMSSSILSIYFVPETQGKTLEEIQQSL
ncbi:unnamed protein product [Callosobruchus maculatus]|uniref:Major facilitator superfamily (MFS) profile domain-containing protein n=1 Tax=Callosobruchus maculatus TaxID=64391 RepID=A0A653BMA4_CALMS|nr:unnamed protein product [Callosobruchus maculatus]